MVAKILLKEFSVFNTRKQQIHVLLNNSFFNTKNKFVLLFFVASVPVLFHSGFHFYFLLDRYFLY